MSKKIVLHIGLHRTGTSSFQATMDEHREEFLAAGIDPFIIAPNRPHAREIGFACVRSGVFERPWDEKATVQLKDQIAEFLRGSEMDRLLFSTEHLSFIRTTAEIEQLKSLFPNEDLEFKIIVVLREKEEWFRSYKDQILKAIDYKPGGQSSRKNVNDDSWVRDHEQMIQLFRDSFDDVQVIGYDSTDMTGKMLGILGIKPNFNTRAYRRNKRSMRFGRTVHLIIRTLFGSEGHGPIKAISKARENFLKNRS
jgi:hypothetical protein